MLREGDGIGPRRALHVLHGLARGGAETLVVNCVQEFLRSDLWHVDVCTFLRGYSLDAALARSPSQHYHLGGRGRYDPGVVAPLRKLTRSYEVVHAHLFPASMFASIAVRGSPPFLITTEHSVWNRRRRFVVFQVLDRLVYQRCSAIVCVSRAVQKALIDWMPGLAAKTRVIHNAVRIAPLAGPCARDIDVLYVGSLNTYVKGVDVLLSALGHVEGELRTVVIAGDGKYRPGFIREVERLGYSEKVRFVGEVANAAALMERARVLVLPSRLEGLPLVLLEGMERATPIVAANVGGISEVVRHGEDSLLVPPENPRALADAIGKLLANRDLRDWLGRNARQTIIQSFSISKHVSSLTALYDEVLRGAPLQPAST